jgi:hypothetical protein
VYHDTPSKSRNFIKEPVDVCDVLGFWAKVEPCFHFCVYRSMEECAMNERQVRQKEHELRAALRVLGHLGIEAELSAGEEPDFVFRRGSKVYGIEVSELQRSAPADGIDPRQNEAETIIVKKLARELYIQRGGVPLNVRVNLNGQRLDQAERGKIASWISDLVYANQPKPGESFKWESRQARYGEYPSQVSSVFSLCLAKGVEHHWPHNFAAYVESEVEETISTAICKKDAKLTNYLKRCELCWLVLVADPVIRGAVSLFDWSNAQSKQYPSNFERVFVVDSLQAAPIELPVTIP